MLTGFEWGLLVLAAWQVSDTWFNGSLFASCRAWLESLQSAIDPNDRSTWPSGTYRSLDAVEVRNFREWWPRFLQELLGCPYCLSHHTPYLVLLAVAVGWSCWPPLGYWILYSLAATRVITLLDGLMPASVQLDRGPELPDPAALPPVTLLPPAEPADAAPKRRRGRPPRTQ